MGLMDGRYTRLGLVDVSQKSLAVVRMCDVGKLYRFENIWRE